jgi:ABC-2 type transport system ATP-binding protein
MKTMTPILEAKNLVKKFGDITAVNDVSFSIEAGEIFSLLGPNGAGKTTTISILSTLIRPTSGEALIAGHSVVRNPIEVKKAIGVVPQEIALYETLSARENLFFWGRMYGMSGSHLRQRVDQVLNQIGLTERANQKVETYSGGMKRRVNIGVGLLHEPRLVFMDEPTVGIDPQSRRSILDTVKSLNKRGMTVLYTTHYMEEAQELSDRIGIIDHGKMIALGTHKELTELVGQQDLLRLHLADSTSALELAASLQELPCVFQATPNDSEIVVAVPEAAEALAPVIGTATRHGVHVRSVDIQEPNLEAVFLHLTGRALRD